MRILALLTGGACAVAMSVSAGATLPMPSDAAAPRQAQAFLFKAGASDIFEIVTSQMAVQHSQNQAVRGFASMLIADHTNSTTQALATAKSAGVMPLPPELSPAQKAMVQQLSAASPADFDRVYLSQQIPAHQQALALMQGYSTQGDVPALRTAASGLIPVIQQHLATAQQLAGGAR
jgi:putative membrane protein